MDEFAEKVLRSVEECESARGDTGVSTSFTSGRIRARALQDVIARIESGESFYVERPEGDRVEVVIATSRAGNKYLKTVADGDVPNNLLALPECP